MHGKEELVCEHLEVGLYQKVAGFVVMVVDIGYLAAACYGLHGAVLLR